MPESATSDDPRAARRKAEEERNEALRRDQIFQQLQADLGPRYADSRLANYEVYGASQSVVLDRLKVLLARLPEHVAAGGGLLLYGEVGTGKDFLAAALCLQAVVRHGLTVRRTTGEAIFAAARAAIRTVEPDDRAVSQWTRPQILLISDPVLVSSPPSDFSRSVLFRLIDQRYVRKLSTWITTNAGSRSEAIELLGPAIYDRLIHDAVACFCSWPSYRERSRPDI